MVYTHKNRMTCSRSVTFELDGEDRIHNVSFVGGCDGNLKAISKLAEGMKAQDYIDRCAGITCGGKPTSCQDQFARGLAEALAERRKTAQKQ